MYEVTFVRKNEQIPDETGAMPEPESTRACRVPAKTAERAVEKAVAYWVDFEGKPLDGYELQPVIDLDA